MKILKHLIFLSLILFLYQCSNDPMMEENMPVCLNGYCITEVDCNLTNSGSGASEGSKKIDLNNDEIDDIRIGQGYRQSASGLTFIFNIEPIGPEVFIASNSFIDTIYACQNDTLSPEEITLFNSNSEFVCSNSGTIDIFETPLTFYPTPFDSYEPIDSNFQWIDSKMILSSNQNISSPASDTTYSWKYDFWLNQNAKYMLFELRGSINRKAFLKIDANETGSLHIYEVGLEDE